MLGLLASRRASGVLVLDAGSVKREVSLRDGCVVQAASDMAEETLGSILVSLGAISGVQRDEIVQQAAEQGRFMGDLLIVRGLMTPLGVIEALNEQVRRRVLNCLRVDGACLRFREEEPRILGFPVKLVVAPFLLRWVAEAISIQRMETHLSLRSKSKLHLEVDVQEALRDLEAGPKEERLIRRLAGGGADPGALQPEYADSLPVVYTLWALGRLKVRSQAPEPSVEQESNAARGAGKPKTADGSCDAKGSDGREANPERCSATRQGLEDKRRRLLGESFKRSLRRAGRVRMGPSRSSRPVDAVLEAWLRADRQDYYILFGVGRDAGPSEIAIAYGALLRRLRLESPPEEWPREAKEAADGLLSRANLAYAVLTDVKERGAYRDHVERGGGEFTVTNPALLVALAIRAADRLRAKGYFERAVARLREAALQHPKEPAVHLALGRTLYYWSLENEESTGEEARSALLLAAEQDPSGDMPWLYLGLLARRRGDEEDAREKFRKALTINPRNERASKELSAFPSLSRLLGKLIKR